MEKKEKGDKMWEEGNFSGKEKGDERKGNTYDSCRKK